MNRRVFLAASTAGLLRAQTPTASFGNLKPMTGDIQPIGEDERVARIEKARRLMRENGIAAIVCQGGASLFYYTGVRWGGRSHAGLGAAGERRGGLGGRGSRSGPRAPGHAHECRPGRHEYPDMGHRRRCGLRAHGAVFAGAGSFRPDRDRRKSYFCAVRRAAAAGAEAGIRERRPGDGRLPGDQVAGGNRPAAARQRHHHRRLPGRVFHLEGGHDQWGAERQRRGRLSRAGSYGRRDGDFRQVHRISARQHSAAAVAGGRPGAGGRRLHRGWVSIRHHADDDFRQAQPAPAARSGIWNARRRMRRWQRPRRAPLANRWMRQRAK